MGRIKRLLTLVLSVAIVLAMNASVFGAEINRNERMMLDSFKEEPFASYLDKKYINQFENFFSQDNVDVEKKTATLFIRYFSKAIVEYKKSGGKGPVFSQSDVSFENFQYAGSTIGLYLEYDSSSNRFYAIDASGYVVLDSSKVIKDTDDAKQGSNSQEGESLGVFR
ncbi:MAG: hypothetical protein IJ889_01155 [Eubacterium sp.]|nr:hypothetical protein [Eubacterium sp.]